VSPSNELGLILTPNDLRPKITSGKYILILDTIWNQSAMLKPDHKKVSLTISTPSKFKATKIGFSHGISCLSKAITIDMKK
jgi:hypothetical protein